MSLFSLTFVPETEVERSSIAVMINTSFSTTGNVRSPVWGEEGVLASLASLSAQVVLPVDEDFFLWSNEGVFSTQPIISTCMNMSSLRSGVQCCPSKPTALWVLQAKHDIFFLFLIFLLISITISRKNRLSSCKKIYQ